MPPNYTAQNNANQSFTSVIGSGGGNNNRNYGPPRQQPPYDPEAERRRLEAQARAEAEQERIRQAEQARAQLIALAQRTDGIAKAHAEQQAGATIPQSISFYQGSQHIRGGYQDQWNHFFKFQADKQNISVDEYARNLVRQEIAAGHHTPQISYGYLDGLNIAAPYEAEWKLHFEQVARAEGISLWKVGENLALAELKDGAKERNLDPSHLHERHVSEGYSWQWAYSRLFGKKQSVSAAMKNAAANIVVSAALLVVGVGAINTEWSFFADRTAELPVLSQANIPASEQAGFFGPNASQTQIPPGEVVVYQWADGQCQFYPSEINVPNGSTVKFISSVPISLEYKQDVWGFLSDNTHAYQYVQDPAMKLNFGSSYINRALPTIQCSTQDKYSHADPSNSNTTQTAGGYPLVANNTLTIHPVAAAPAVPAAGH